MNEAKRGMDFTMFSISMLVVQVLRPGTSKGHERGAKKTAHE